MSTENSEAVIREITPDVWTISTPFSRMGIPMGNRTVAIRLRAGGVWVLPSTPLDGPTKAKVDELGAVSYILSGDSEHRMFLAEYKKAYPQAKLIAPPLVADQQSSKEGLAFDGVFGDNPAAGSYGFETDVLHCYFSGHSKGDVAFYHPASRSLIVQDLLMNLSSRTEQYENSDKSGHIPLQDKIPLDTVHKAIGKLTGKDKEAMRRDAQTVSAWDFDRIIPCHGDVIETGAKEAWMSAYAQYLK